MTEQNDTQRAPEDKICAEEYIVKRGDSFYTISHKLGVSLRDLLAANRDIHPARLMVGDVLCVPREEDDSVPNGGSTGSDANGSMSGSSGNGTNGGASAGSGTGSGASGGTNGGTAGSSGAGNGTNGNTNGNPSSGSGTGSSTNGNASGGSNGNSGSTSGSGGTVGDGTAMDQNTVCPIENRVTIGRDETIADIQLRNELNRSTLQSANPNVDLDQLSAGQVVCVPDLNRPCAIPSTYQMTSGETLETVAVKFNLPIASLLRANPCLAPQDFEAGTAIILPK